MEIKEIPWLTIVGILIGLTGIILYIVGKRNKKPVYAIRSTNLIQDFTSRFEALEIKYANERIANFTATKVAFWNNGKETINGGKGGDIATTDQLMIKVKNGYKFLDSDVLHPKKDDNPNQFSIKPSEDGSHVLIQFEYLDKGQGGVMQLLHTGKSSDDVEVCGRIKGAGNPKRCSIPIITPAMSLSERWSVYFMCFILPVLLFIGFFSDLRTFRSLPLFMKVFTTAIIVILSGFGFYMFKRRMPKGFEIFFEKISANLK